MPQEDPKGCIVFANLFKFVEGHCWCCFVGRWDNNFRFQNDASIFQERDDFDNRVVLEANAALSAARALQAIPLADSEPVAGIAEVLTI